jgi:DNA-binding beta-propeller fold protein YncE
MNRLPIPRSISAALVAASVGFLATVEALALVPGPTKTYTTNADFDLGLLFNLNHTVNSDQLQLNAQISTFPLLWVANSGEDTVSKIDTNTGKEVGRYRTWFNVGLHDAWTGPAPSRTAVDAAGNCYVANRHFDGRPAEVMKILASGFIDRNGNGIMETSTDSNNNGVIDGSELMPLIDSNGNGIVDPSEIQDERIAWIVQVGPGNGIGRSLSIAPDGSIWVGLYNSQAYYKLDPTTGAQLAGPISVAPNRPYGSVIDASGILWGSGWNSYNMVKLDTNTNTFMGTFGL